MAAQQQFDDEPDIEVVPAEISVTDLYTHTPRFVKYLWDVINEENFYKQKTDKSRSFNNLLGEELVTYYDDVSKIIQKQKKDAISIFSNLLLQFHQHFFKKNSPQIPKWKHVFLEKMKYYSLDLHENELSIIFRFFTEYGNQTKKRLYIQTIEEMYDNIPVPRQQQKKALRQLLRQRKKPQQTARKRRKTLQQTARHLSQKARQLQHSRSSRGRPVHWPIEKFFGVFNDCRGEGKTI